MESFDEFEAFLKHKGPWLAGMDFPFGQPRQFLDKMKLPEQWNKYIQAIHKWKRERFEKKVRHFKNHNNKGNKEPLRITDAFSRAEITERDLLAGG